MKLYRSPSVKAFLSNILKCRHHNDIQILKKKKREKERVERNNVDHAMSQTLNRN